MRYRIGPIAWVRGDPLSVVRRGGPTVHAAGTTVRVEA